LIEVLQGHQGQQGQQGRQAQTRLAVIQSPLMLLQIVMH
jgi:hypothetical protein